MKGQMAIDPRASSLVNQKGVSRIRWTQWRPASCPKGVHVKTCHCLIALLAALAPTVAKTEVFRCTTAAGKVEYSDGSFRRGGTNEAIQLRLQLVLNSYRNGGFSSGREEVFLSLAEAAWAEIPGDENGES